jgi:hypothetical protein
MTTADGFGTKAWENGKVVFYVDYKNKKIVLYDSKEKLRLVFKWDLTINLYHLVE